MIVIAHRGASWDEPENTLAAFERAIADGADFVEFDVHADRDGRLVVTHDAPRAGREYPSLASVLDLCRGRIPVMVELKRPGRYRRHEVIRRTVDLLDADAVVLCFQRAPLEEVRRLRPGLRTMQHVGFGVSIRRAAGFANERLTRRGLAAAHALGLAAAVYTVNEQARMRDLRDLGVDAIFTDRPVLALRTLRG